MTEKPEESIKINSTLNLTSPLNEQNLDYGNLVLEWEKPQSMENPEYEVYFKSDINPEIVSTVKTTKYNFKTDNLKARHYWKIIAKEGEKSIKSEEFSFKITNISIILKTENEKIFNISDNIILNWEKLKSTKDYTYKIYIDDEEYGETKEDSLKLLNLNSGKHKWKVVSDQFESEEQYFIVENKINGKISNIEWNQLKTHSGKYMGGVKMFYYNGYIHMITRKSGSPNYLKLNTSTNNWEQGNYPENLEYIDAAVVYNNKIHLIAKGKNSLKICIWENEEWNITETNIPSRSYYKCTVFNNKLWLAGGLVINQNGSYKPTAEVWSSDNGKEWKLETTNGMGGPRSNFTFFSHKNKLYVNANDSRWGGINGYYSSEDGVSWEKINIKGYNRQNLPQSLQLTESHFSWRGYIWFFNINGDIYVSENGIDYKRKSGGKFKNRQYFYVRGSEKELYYYGGNVVGTDDYIQNMYKGRVIEN
jgi:hypothetical protein